MVDEPRVELTPEMLREAMLKAAGAAVGIAFADYFIRYFGGGGLLNRPTMDGEEGDEETLFSEEEPRPKKERPKDPAEFVELEASR